MVVKFDSEKVMRTASAAFQFDANHPRVSEKILQVDERLRYQ
jgi:hypothetical protein